MTDGQRQRAGSAGHPARLRRRVAWFAWMGCFLLLSCAVGLSLAGTARAAGYAFSVMAGTAGSAGYSDSAPVQFDGPEGLAFDSAGDLMVADCHNYVIRLVTPAGVVSTYAGQPGIGGNDNGPRGTATFWYPTALVTDTAGNLYVSSDYSPIRRIDATTGQVTSYATGFEQPEGMAFGPDGDLYVTDMQNETVSRVTSNGTVTTVAGQAGVAGHADNTSALSATFDAPRGITFDAAGNIYVTDYYSCIIRRIDHATGAVTTIAGQANVSGYKDGIGSAALFSDPSAITCDAAGDLLVADQGNGCIRKLHFNGTAWQVSTASNPGGLDSPMGLVLDSAGHLFVGDENNDVVDEGTLDATPPTTTASGLQATTSSWTNAADTVTLNATDTTFDIAATYYTIGGGVTQTYKGPFTVSSPGSTTVTYWSSDVVGNVETPRTRFANIDTSTPTITVSGNDAAWHRHAVTLTFTPVADPSGVAGVEYRIGSGAWTAVSKSAGHYRVAISTEGANAVSYRTTNNAGTTSAVGSCTVNIDTSTPTITVSGNDAAWHRHAVTLTFTPVADPSGVAGVEYRIGSGAWTAVSKSAGHYRVAISTEGANAVSYRTTNNAGTTSAVGSCTVNIDTSTPTITVSGNDAAWHRHAVTLTFTPVADPSGVAGVEYRIGSGAWTAVSKSAGHYRVAISTEGANAVSYRTTNNAGTTSAVGSCTVKVDSFAPHLVLANSRIEMNTHAHAKLRLRLLWTDATSTRCRLSVIVTQYGHLQGAPHSYNLRGNGRWQTISLPWRWPTGKYELHLSLRDQAGNRCYSSATVVSYKWAPRLLLLHSRRTSAVGIGTVNP